MSLSDTSADRHREGIHRARPTQHAITLPEVRGQVLDFDLVITTCNMEALRVQVLDSSYALEHLNYDIIPVKQHSSDV